jgi:hypothetical protein
LNYTFQIPQLEILNHLIVDSSVEYTDMVDQLERDPIVLDLERRTVEHVIRKKWLIGTTTHYRGKHARLTISGVKKATLKDAKDRFKDNHFINGMSVADSGQTVRLLTSFGLELLLESTDDFSITLIDRGASDFSRGMSLGKHGFNKAEWKAYLTEAKYTPQPTDGQQHP